MKRQRMGRKNSRRQFKRGTRSHSRNRMDAYFMRGGIRW